MRRFLVFAGIMAVMCVAASSAESVDTILISATGWVADQATLNQPTVDFYTDAFPNATVVYGDYGNTDDATVQAALLGADLLVIARTNYSSDYTTADDDWWNANLSIPIIVHSSYFTRAARMNWESGAEAAPGIDGAETTVTAAGAKIFGAEGTFDWWGGTGAFDRVGSGTVGDGEILATIGGNNAVVGWRAGDKNARGTTMLGDRLLFNFHVNGGGMPDTAAGRQALLAAVKAYVEPDTPDKPHEPVVLPENVDGSAGTLLANNVDVEVTLSFKAAMDADQVYPVHPDILGHYIYMSNGTSDPNIYLLDYVEQAHDPDPMLTDPSVSYGPITLINAQGKYFSWQVEEALDDGTGTPYPAGDPNNILGHVWNFTAVGAAPNIFSGPEHTLTDANGNASLAITTGAIANNFRWFKIVGAQDTAENGETDDIQLTDAGIFSGTTTKTLTVTGAASDGSDDARIYAVAYNGDPDGINLAVASPAAWFWYPRLVNHYAFEVMNVVDGNNVTPDIVSGYDMMMMSNDTGLDVPALDTSVEAGLAASTQSLKFDNPRANPADPNNVDAQYAQVSAPWAGSYEDVTLSLWVYSNGGSNWNRILDFGNDNANYMFLCMNPGSVNGSVRFAVNVGGTEQSVSSAAGALPDNEWTYITATLSGDTGRLYINGELVATNTALTNDPILYGPTTQNWLARSQWGAPDGYFNGLVDELKIYNYARTTEQIAQDYLDVRGEWICNRELYNLPYDFDGDCVISLGDFAIFAATWLDSYRIFPD